MCEQQELMRTAVGWIMVAGAAGAVYLLGYSLWQLIKERP